MKKSLLALAALTAFAGAASAQSSVTLFGVVDVSVRGVDNDTGARTTLNQDGNASSRLGLRGVEDLGGGLKAGFWLEGAINPDNGTPGGQTWQRRSTVSLMGGWGEVRLGRDYVPTFWNHTVFDPFGTNGVGQQTNLLTLQGEAGGTVLLRPTLVRTNNTIGYFLPAMGGLYGQLMLGLDEGDTGASTGANSNYAYWGGRIGYAAGPFNVAFAYGETKGYESTGPLDLSTDMSAWNIAGSWNFGFMTLMGQYHEYDEERVKLSNYMIGATAQLGSGQLKASYGMTEVDSSAARI